MNKKTADRIASRARIVRNEDRGYLVRDDETGTVLGYVQPVYSGMRRTGWKYSTSEIFMPNGRFKTRQEAAVQCALAWIRQVTTRR